MREPWVQNKEWGLNRERVSRQANPFRVSYDFKIQTQGSRKLEPWAEISERLRRNKRRFGVMSERLTPSFDFLKTLNEKHWRPFVALLDGSHLDQKQVDWFL